MMRNKIKNSELISIWPVSSEQLGVYTRGRMTRSLRKNVESKDTEEENQGKMDQVL